MSPCSFKWGHHDQSSAKHDLKFVVLPPFDSLNFHLNRLATQSSYLSRISRVIFLEKKLTCGEKLGNFGKNLGKFWEILWNFEKFWVLPQFMRFHVEKNWAQIYICEEKMTNMRSDCHPSSPSLLLWTTGSPTLATGRTTSSTPFELPVSQVVPSEAASPHTYNVQPTTEPAPEYFFIFFDDLNFKGSIFLFTFFISMTLAHVQCTTNHWARTWGSKPMMPLHWVMSRRWWWWCLP